MRCFFTSSREDAFVKFAAFCICHFVSDQSYLRILGSTNRTKGFCCSYEQYIYLKLVNNKKTSDFCKSLRMFIDQLKCAQPGRKLNIFSVLNCCFCFSFCMMCFRMCLHIGSVFSITLAYFTLIEPLLGCMRLCVTFVAHNLSSGGWCLILSSPHMDCYCNKRARSLEMRTTLSFLSLLDLLREVRTLNFIAAYDFYVQ